MSIPKIWSFRYGLLAFLINGYPASVPCFVSTGYGLLAFLINGYLEWVKDKQNTVLRIISFFD